MGRIEIRGRIDRDSQMHGLRTVTCEPDGTCTHETPADYAPNSRQWVAFRLTDISFVMHRKGWHVAGALMERWFAGRAYAMNVDEKEKKTPYPADLTETQLVKFAWALKFPEVAAAYQALIRPDKLLSPLARSVLLKKLVKNGFFQPALLPERQTAMQNAPALHAQWQFQYIKVNDGLSSQAKHYAGGMDDLFAALGSFALYAAPARVQVEPQTDGSARIRIPAVAIYICDTYDFIDKQYLGHWNRHDLRLSLSDPRPGLPQLRT